jgi:hypothetical protein
MVELLWWQLALVFAGSPVLAALVSWLMTRKKSKVDVLDVIINRLTVEVSRLESLYNEEKKSGVSSNLTMTDLGRKTEDLLKETESLKSDLQSEAEGGEDKE